MVDRTLKSNYYCYPPPPPPKKKVNTCDAMMMTCEYVLCWCLPQSGGIKSMSWTSSFNCLSMKIMSPVGIKQIKYMFCTQHLMETNKMAEKKRGWETRNYCPTPRLKSMQSGGEASGNGNAGYCFYFSFPFHYLSLNRPDITELADWA